MGTAVTLAFSFNGWHEDDEKFAETTERRNGGSRIREVFECVTCPDTIGIETGCPNIVHFKSQERVTLAGVRDSDWADVAPHHVDRGKIGREHRSAITFGAAIIHERSINWIAHQCENIGREITERGSGEEHGLAIATRQG